MSRERVVALVDMDCFYVQVEQRLNPSYIGKPCAVVQYNAWKGGGIIAVSYEARKFGVTRNMRGDEAKEKCPDIILARVPELRGKADLTRYRDAGAEVIAALQTFCDICERASVDEAYLDLTSRVEKELKNITLEELVDKTLACSHVIGYTDKKDSDKVRGQWLAALSDKNIRCLAMGAVIIQQARDAVKEKTGFTCSAGIAHNKVLAKIAGGSHKPNQQTLLPQHSVQRFFETIPIRKVRFFGGKFGESVVNSLHVQNMSELTKYTQEELQRVFGEKSGAWLYDMCRGREYEPVRQRQLSKSCGCGKNFTGKAKLISKEKVRYWLLQLASELSDRLKIEEEKNNRAAKLVSVGLSTETNTTAMRSFPLRSLDPENICDNAIQVIKSFNSGHADTWKPGITMLSLNANKFEDISKSSGTSSIASFFAKKQSEDGGTQKQPRSKQTDEVKAHSSSCLDVTSLDISKPSGTSSIASFFAKKQSEDGGTQKQPRSKQTDEVKAHSSPCLDVTNSDIPKSLGTSSIASFFAKKQGEDGGTPKQPRSKQTNGIKAHSNPCSNVTGSDNVELTNYSYERDEIDQSIINELPDNIRNGIQKFVGVSKNSERTKRTSNGIEKYTVSRSTSETKPTQTNDITGNITDNTMSTKTNDYIGNTKTDLTLSDNASFIRCSKCGQQVAQSKMDEHKDFHFAFDLQKQGGITFDSMREDEPPKKRQKGTISKFFVSKRR